MAVTISSGGIWIVGIVFLALYMTYRRILPKPIPDIPYNKNAAAKVFGDVPEMMGYVMRTRRIFVRHSHYELAVYRSTRMRIANMEA